MGARKGKWSFYTDVMWVDLKVDDLGRIVQDVELEEWIVTPKIGYRAFEGDWGFVDLQVRARYTWAKLTIEGERPLAGGSFRESASGSIWDGLAGFSGEYNIDENWYIPFMAEAGTGDSDFVAGAIVGIGRRFEYADVFLGFKYLYYDFASGAPMKDETGYGPVLSAKFSF